ncbi:MauE/DoxX family redox-associated membrane protein [Pedobacter heparinus]|uniref:MauE/DoxX family redox-associated membrane protein n=1 Tax=Pedobacter heparinus TaxID=984 RepID=UPI00292F6FF9|nr:MauE/DoxX family redox-associated membrane protein [Pedobacter heparinus]
MNLRKLTFIISLQLAALLLYAAGLKLWGYTIAKAGFEFYPFVKDYHAMLFWTLMVLQIGIVCLLVFNRTRLMGLYSTFILLASLSTYLYVMLHYAEQVPCYCTGIIPGLSWEGHLWFTVSFTILAGINIVLLPKDIHAHG